MSNSCARFGGLLLLLMSAQGSAYADESRLTPPEHGQILVAIVIGQSANLMDFAGPWEAFQDTALTADRAKAYGDEGPFRLYTVSDTRAPITVGFHLVVTPEYTFDDAPPPQVIVVGAQQSTPRMLAWLKKWNADKHLDAMMSVCTGAFRLASAGLLDGKPATTHHDYLDEFAKYFPKVQLRRGARYVESDPHLFTAGGVTSGIDLALHVVALYFGEDTASRTAAHLEYERVRGHDD